MRKVVFFSGLVLLILFYACSYNITIRPDLDVTATIANPINFRVGLYMPPEMKGLKMADRADWASKYTFNVGEAVGSIIFKALTRVFRYCEILETYPTEIMLEERKLDYVVAARINEASAALSTQSGWWTQDASGNVQISANLTFLDPSLIQFTTVQATGTGMANEGIDLLSTGSKEYTVPVEAAIRNLGNNIVQQVYGNYDIRKKAEEKK